MFNIFSRKAKIDITIAETAAKVMADKIKEIPSNEWLGTATNIVRESLGSIGVTEELRDHEYREICQLAVKINSAGGQYNMTIVRECLKSF